MVRTVYTSPKVKVIVLVIMRLTANDGKFAGMIANQILGKIIVMETRGV
ncbi:hypothetical protein [Kiloniella sp.]